MCETARIETSELWDEKRKWGEEEEEEEEKEEGDRASAADATRSQRVPEKYTK